MKFIITEEQNIRLQILRRLDEIWGIIRNSYPFIYPCDYHGLGHFAIALKAEFSYIDSEGFFRDNANEIWDVVSKIYAKKIKERYDESNCDGEPVIEESDSHEQKKWKRFEMFMRRRGEQIRDIISQHSHAYQYDIERYDEDVLISTMFDLVIGDFCDINKIDYEDKEYDWVYFYIKDNYTDYIKKVLGFLDKDTITEEEGKENKFKKDKWCKYIEEIVLNMKIYKLCGVQVRAMDNTFGDDESFRHYLVILETHTRGTEFETKVRLHINDFLPHLDVIVITLPCDTKVKITEDIDRKKQLNKLFRRINPNDLLYHLDLIIYDEIEWHLRDKNVIPLEKLGETEFVYLVIEHLWEYIYDTFVESSVTYRDDEILEIKGGIQSLFGDRIRNVYHKAIEKKSLTESSSLSKKLTDVIQNKGIGDALDIVGGYDDLVRIVGEGTITREIEENFIRDIVLEHGGISVHDLNEDPIVYKESDGDVWEIYYLGIRRVSITIWYDAGYGDRNDISVSYESLSNKHIHEIFIMLVEHYIKGFNLP